MQAIDKNTEFYLNLEGKERGPYSLDKLLENGLTPDTFVWWQGAANWVKADIIPELKALFENLGTGEPKDIPSQSNEHGWQAIISMLTEQLVIKDRQLEALTRQQNNLNDTLLSEPRSPKFNPVPTKLGKSDNRNIHFLFLSCVLVLLSIIPLYGLLSNGKINLDRLIDLETMNHDEYSVYWDYVSMYPIAAGLCLSLLLMTWLVALTRCYKFAKFMSILCFGFNVILAIVLALCYFNINGYWRLEYVSGIGLFFVAQMASLVLLALYMRRIIHEIDGLKSKYKYASNR